jgi:hypothetical protein
VVLNELTDEDEIKNLSPSSEITIPGLEHPHGPEKAAKKPAKSPKNKKDAGNDLNRLMGSPPSTNPKKSGSSTNRGG